MAHLAPTTLIYVSLAAVVVVFFLGKRLHQSTSRWKYAREHGCRPPLNTVSRGIGGLGSLWEMLSAAQEHHLLESVRGWYLEQGNTFIAKMVGRTVTFTIEPKNVQTVLALKFKDFELGSFRNNAFKPLLGQGIFASDGDIWEHSRAMVRPNFVRNQITDIDIYETHVAKVIRLIPRDGSMVDLQNLFFRMTLDSATEFLFGESVNSLHDGSTASAVGFAQNFNTAQDGLALRSRIGPLMYLHWDSKFSKATVEARHYVDQFVQKAIEYRTRLDHHEKDTTKHPHDQQYVFLYELSKRTLDKTELTDQLLNILLAGRDTTASLLSITFFILARRPDVWKRLRAEVLTLDGRKPSFEDLKSMTYLMWVLNETLRLYPVVPVNVRMANKDTFLPLGGGPDGEFPVFIPKGQEVIYSVYSMHRMPEVYGPDANEYRPERWEKLKPGWAYIPFNGGPRICIGQQFALTEAGYTTVRILQEFQNIVCRDPQEDFEEWLTLTLASKNGTKVAMTPA